MRLHAAALALLLFAGVAQAQDADLVLLNGKIVTLAARDDIQEALAIRDGKVLAVGRSNEMRKRAGPNATIVDLGGRTVIPGLIDSHMHAVRAGLFFGREVNWTEPRRARLRSCRPERRRYASTHKEARGLRSNTTSAAFLLPAGSPILPFYLATS